MSVVGAVGHEVRRWNYPRETVPKRIPIKAAAGLKAAEASGAQPEAVALARELAARCTDFRQVDALYDEWSPAQTYWPEAYLGVIETAYFLPSCGSGEPHLHAIKQLAHTIMPGVVGRVSRGLPTSDGLSPNFTQVLAYLEEATARLARTAHNVDVLANDTPASFRAGDLLDGMRQAYDKALQDFQDVLRTILEHEVAQTPHDRLLMRRVIEIRFGPPLIWRVFAKFTMGLGTTHNLIDLRDVNRIDRHPVLGPQPTRLEHTYWAWIHTQKYADEA